MIVLLRHGLANRLRTIVGFWYVAERLGQTIEFHWDTKNSECNGSWEDIFQPLEIVKSRPLQKGIQYTFIGQNTVDKIISTYFPDEKRATWDSAFIKKIEDKYYSRMVIRPEILRAANEATPLHPFAAVHIRRTDHVSNAKKAGCYTTFEEFEAFIALHKKCYLATDSRDVQKKYPNLLVYREIPKENAASLRQTSLFDAMVDIIVCARADNFKGSGYSSFSHLIKIYNRLKV